MEKITGLLGPDGQPLVETQPTDVHQEIGPDRLAAIDDRYQERVGYALKAKTHLWIAGLVHVLGDESLESLDGKGGQLSFDHESLLMRPQIGCYVCEKPYSPRERLRKCAGQPKAGA